MLTLIDENGSNLTSEVANTGGPLGLVNNNLYVFGQDDNGTADSFVPDQLASAFIGGGLSPTQRTQMSCRSSMPI